MQCPDPRMPTGYANQARVWLPRLRAAGHDLAVICTAGTVRYDTEWDGIPVFGRSPYTDAGEDLSLLRYKSWGADLIITLCCPWILHPQVWREMRTIHLMPVDCEPLSYRDYKLISEGGGTPAAVSRFGERMLRGRGLDPLYLPHGIDTAFWTPAPDRAALRGPLDSRFVVGINANNADTADRKALSEQMRAFAAFRKNHRDAVLAMHTLKIAPDGLNLESIAQQAGITDAVLWSDQGRMASGGYTDEELRDWYRALDVLMCCSRGEGYGLPMGEAQACGTPVITMGWSTGPELAGPGWTVSGQPERNEVHHADWHVPFIRSIARQLGRAYNGAGTRRDAARQFAADHLDADMLFAQHWKPVFDELG